MRAFHPICLAVLATLMAPAAGAQDGAALFTDNCAPCHTIGEGDGVGPDLRDVGKRRERVWLLAFVADPEAMAKSGDPSAVALVKKYDGTMMPSTQGIGADGISAILDYVAERSAGPAGVAAETAPAQPVFTAEDIARGRALFDGTRRSVAGGPPCLSCHAAGVEPGLGGGALGPDLAGASRRLNGPKGLTAWLSAPPTPVMRATFRSAPLTPDEITGLAAFLDDRGRQNVPGARTPLVRLLGSGLAGAIAGFVVMGAVWRNRLRSVRRGLVASAARRSARSATHRSGFRSGGVR